MQANPSCKNDGDEFLDVFQILTKESISIYFKPDSGHKNYWLMYYQKYSHVMMKIFSYIGRKSLELEVPNKLKQV